MFTKNRLDKLNNITVRGAKPTFFILIAIFMALLILSCADTSDGGTMGGGGETDNYTATLTELIRTGNTIRPQYIAFDIKADNTATVKLVLKKKSETAPTRDEMLNGAGVYRKLTTTNKLVVMAYDIASNIKKYKTDAVAGGSRIITIHNTTTTSLTSRPVDSYFLDWGTGYTLYAVRTADDGAVKTVGDITTDRMIDTANLPTNLNFNDTALYNRINRSTTPLNISSKDAANVLALVLPSSDLVLIEFKHGFLGSAPESTAPPIADYYTLGATPSLSPKNVAITNWEYMPAFMVPSYSLEFGVEKSYGGKRYHFDFALIDIPANGSVPYVYQFTNVGIANSNTFNIYFTLEE